MEKITDKNIYLAIDERIDRLDTLLINRISVLEDRIKYLEKVDKSYKNDIDDLEDKINNYQHEINLPKIINDLHKKNNKLNNKIDDLEEKIKHNAENIDTIHDNTNSNLEEISNNRFKIDDLEAKNYQLKSELDGIYKVLEMDACDIQELQDKM